MRHFTIDLDQDRVVEICCCQPGAYDGRWMGYAIKFAGTWDGWVSSLHDHGTMRKCAIAVTREAAIKAVAENWN